MTSFNNLGDLIRRDRDLAKTAIIDLGGETRHRARSAIAALDQTGERGRAGAHPRAGSSAASALRCCRSTGPNISPPISASCAPDSWRCRSISSFRARPSISSCAIAVRKLVFCDQRAPRRVPGRSARGLLRRRRAPRVRIVPRSRTVRRRRAGRGRARDVPLHLGLDRPPKGVVLSHREPDLGGASGASTARASRTTAISSRRRSIT